jgi:hypothetical protein
MQVWEVGFPTSQILDLRRNIIEELMHVGISGSPVIPGILYAIDYHNGVFYLDPPIF